MKYGEKYGVCIESKEGYGTKFELKLPLINHS